MAEMGHQPMYSPRAFLVRFPRERTPPPSLTPAASHARRNALWPRRGYRPPRRLGGATVRAGRSGPAAITRGRAARRPCGPGSPHAPDRSPRAAQLTEPCVGNSSASSSQNVANLGCSPFPTASGPNAASVEHTRLDRLARSTLDLLHTVDLITKPRQAPAHWRMPGPTQRHRTAS